MQPILFRWGDLVIPSYVAMLALGAAVLFWVTTATAERHSLYRGHMALLLTAAYLTGLIGARILFVLEHYSLYANPMEAFLSPIPGGLASYGGLLSGCLVAVAYSMLFRLPLGKVVDSAAIGLCLFGVSARLGCFLAGCCYGRPTGLPWAVLYPPNADAAARWGGGVPIHPAPLYEAGYLLGIAALLPFAEKRFRFPGGKFLCLVAAYSAARFLNELVRGDSLLRFWSLTPPQWISLALLAAALGFLAWRRRFVMIAASG